MCVLSKVYIFGFIFCVENLNIICYLVEFWMVEFEFVFVILVDNVKLVEDMLKYVFKMVLVECFDDMVFFVKYIDKEVIICFENFIVLLFV